MFSRLDVRLLSIWIPVKDFKDYKRYPEPSLNVLSKASRYILLGYPQK